jgi:hypothetical protein
MGYQVQGALASPTNPLTQLKLRAGNAIGTPLGSLAPASGGAIGNYIGQKALSTAPYNKKGTGPPTEYAAFRSLATGHTPQNWWTDTGNQTGNLQANGLMNEYLLPSNAMTPGTFGYVSNPNIQDPALRASLDAYAKQLNNQLRTAGYATQLTGKAAAGPLGPVKYGDSGYNDLQQANPDKLPRFTDANAFGAWQAASNDAYGKLYEENKRAGVQGVGINSPGMEKLKKSNPTLYAKNEAVSVKSPDYTRQIIHDATAQRQSIAEPGGKTAGDEWQSWQPKWLQNAGGIR